jgi:hypothetical protein
MKTLNVPDAMLTSLLEHVEGCDYCCLCDHHPGPKHYNHAPACPLRATCPHPGRDGENCCVECGREMG